MYSGTRIVFKLRLWGARLGSKDVSDPNFIVLRRPFNLLRIFKDGFHRIKAEFMLGPGSILFVDLPFTNIHVSYSHFSKYPSSGDRQHSYNLTILTSEHHGRQIPTSESPILANKSASSGENRLFVSSHSYHPPLWEALQSYGVVARYVCVGS